MMPNRSRGTDLRHAGPRSGSGLPAGLYRQADLDLAAHTWAFRGK